MDLGSKIIVGSPQTQEYRSVPPAKFLCQPLSRERARASAASLAISADANPQAFERMLGHASAAMTLDTYTDLFEDDFDAVSERLDAVRAQTVVRFSWVEASRTGNKHANTAFTGLLRCASGGTWTPGLLSRPAEW